MIDQTGRTWEMSDFQKAGNGTKAALKSKEDQQGSAMQGRVKLQASIISKHLPLRSALLPNNLTTQGRFN
jgi:hypothetical protein